MPVQKFRSIEEMNRAAVPSSAEQSFERFLRHCARYWAIAPSVTRVGSLSFVLSKRHRRNARNTQPELWIRKL